MPGTHTVRARSPDDRRSRLNTGVLRAPCSNGRGTADESGDDKGGGGDGANEGGGGGANEGGGEGEGDKSRARRRRLAGGFAKRRVSSDEGEAAEEWNDEGICDAGVPLLQRRGLLWVGLGDFERLRWRS